MHEGARRWSWIAVWVFASITGCIDDLPEATTGAGGAAAGGGSGATQCMSRGGPVDASCLSLQGEPPGCSTDKAACYRSDASDCQCRAMCGDNTCPNPEMACPAAVTALGGSCLVVSESPQDTACTPCGCGRCMQTCDGVGPTFALRPDSTEFLVSWPITAPAQGTLGVYMRARGRFSGLMIGTSQGSPRPFPSPMGSTSPETELASYIARNVDEWTGPADSPDLLAIGVQMGSSVVIEIDCVVPFVE